jgi:hypothetical protein
VLTTARVRLAKRELCGGLEGCLRAPTIYSLFAGTIVARRTFISLKDASERESEQEESMRFLRLFGTSMAIVFMLLACP